jgi:hypothetical protein
MAAGFLTKKRIMTPIVCMIAAILLGGCGGSSDGSGDSVSVETGSLSKAEFVSRANAICTAVRNQFTREYEEFVTKGRKGHSAAEESAFLHETIEKLVVPDYEDRMIGGIATLGAPPAYAPEVTKFLEALKQRLVEIQDDPEKLIQTAFPFSSASKAAQAAGLKGCANSFS